MLLTTKRKVIILGLFNNYEKPGPGINKNAPRAKGLKLFFELYSRKFGSYLQLNFFYFTSLIPAIAIVWYFVMMLLNDLVNLGEDTLIAATFLAFILSVVICCAFGLSPFSAGFHYILRNFSFEKHAFVFSDFIEKFRQNKKNAIIMFIIDLVAVLAIIILFRFYLIISFGNTFFMVPLTLLVLISVVYSLMTPYKWTMLVTFDMNKRTIYKNALFLVLSDFKTTAKHFAATAFYVVLLVALVYLIPVVGIILFALSGFSVFGLISQLNIYQQMQDLISQSPGGHENIR